MRATRNLLAGLALMGSAVGLAAGVSSASASQAKASLPTIVIGSTNFTEQYIVANLYGDVLQHAGFKVQIKANLGARQEVVPALERGALDLEPDYAGTLLLYLNTSAGAKANNIKTAVPALDTLLAKHGVTVLDPANAIDTNVFAITKATDTKYHLGKSPTLSSLKPYASQLVLGGPPECPQNATCEPGLANVYGLHFKSFQPTDEAGPISVAALKDNTVQVVEFFSSDGNIVNNHFVQLQDDKHLQAADYLIPVIRKSVDTPKVAAALNALSGRLTTTALSNLNLKVNDQHQSASAVARAWLVQKGII
ncbi:MAG: L-proline glycine betaine binding transporter protein ProX [Acidimicrobiaceae bacterium]|jgi:osmoprotectant transport system substrate-binding protein|nr:L-proline glycine betaine binding transporter protein ProX [Acidimicrobiaceae bacterium]